MVLNSEIYDQGKELHANQSEITLDYNKKDHF